MREGELTMKKRVIEGQLGNWDSGGPITDVPFALQPWRTFVALVSSNQSSIRDIWTLSTCVRCSPVDPENQYIFVARNEARPQLRDLVPTPSVSFSSACAYGDSES